MGGEGGVGPDHGLLHEDVGSVSGGGGEGDEGAVLGGAPAAGEVVDGQGPGVPPPGEEPAGELVAGEQGCSAGRVGGAGEDAVGLGVGEAAAVLEGDAEDGQG